jgi:hypothetical protein
MTPKDPKDLPGAETSPVAGENLPPEAREPTHEEGGADSSKAEPLGPFTPDDETPLGDTPEAHDEISPHDLPKGHPGRVAAEEDAAAHGGTTKGNV